MKCKVCKGKIPFGQNLCPSCGYERNPFGCLTGCLTVLGILFLIILAIIAALFFFREPILTFVSSITQSIAQEVAYPLPEQVNGDTDPTQAPLNMQNPYNILCPDRDAYFIPETQERKLTGAELSALSKEALVLARNEIFARHGYIFSDAELSEYFSGKNWYTPTVTGDQFSSAVMSDIEISNVDFIRHLEQRLKGVTFSDDNPYAACYQTGVDFLFPHSSTEALQEYELYFIDAEKACIGRNEILARHGYTFTDKHLMEYFLHFDWYAPTTAPGDSSGLSLNSIEAENIQLLQDHQNVIESIGDLSSVNTAYTNTVSHSWFSLTTPAYWVDYTICSVDTEGIRFLESVSNQLISGGRLVTLRLCSSEEAYISDFELVGYLTDPSGKVWHLLAVRPSDVQFIPAASILYSKLSDDISTVIDTITAAPGCSFTPV